MTKFFFLRVRRFGNYFIYYQCFHHIETSHLICTADHSTGFYMMERVNYFAPIILKQYIKTFDTFYSHLEAFIIFLYEWQSDLKKLEGGSRNEMFKPQNVNAHIKKEQLIL